MKAEVRLVGGRPELYLDGRLASRMIARAALPGRYAEHKIDQYEPAGIDVYMTESEIPNSLCWDGQGGYDYTLYEHQIGRMVRRKSDIRLILFVGCGGETPYLWNRSHVDELGGLATGGRFGRASIASDVWLRDSSEAMARFVRHFERGPFAENIIGYNPIWMGNEWFGLTWENEGRSTYYDDYSPAMTRRFRAWLRERYEGDSAALRESWRDSAVTFDTAEIPSLEERLALDQASLLCLEKGLCVADYHRCYSESNARLAMGWCRAIKEALETAKLAGLMFGVSFFAKGAYPQHRGHGAARMILECPDIDYLHSPPNYTNTRDFHYSMHAIDTVLQHGKLFFNQMDAKTYLYPQDEDRVQSEGSQPGYVPRAEWETLQIMKRDVSYPLTRNCACYWLEGGPGPMFPITPHGIGGAKLWSRVWYDDPLLKEMIARLKALYDENQKARAEAVAEIAVVTSNESMYYRRPEQVFRHLFAQGLRNVLTSRLGTPFDDYLLEDFDRIERGYKVYLFTDALYMTPESRRLVARKLEVDRATALWFYAPGYVDGRRADPAFVEEITGIRMGCDHDKRPLQVRITTADHPLVRGLAPGQREFGSAQGPSDIDRSIWRGWDKERESFCFSPVFYADDPGAEVLGLIAGLDKPGLAVKGVGPRRSIWFGAPVPPPRLVKNILADSGVHIYSDAEDLVYANSRYVSVFAHGDGPRALRLPRPCDVRDALEGTLLARAATSVSYESRDREARIFRLG